MKLSIVSKTDNNSHIGDILNACKKRRIEANVVPFDSPNNLKENISKLGDVVYWRASYLDLSSERTAAGKLLKDRIVINRAIFDQPYVAHKYYQQQIMSKYRNINTITTLRFKSKSELKQAIEDHTLKYPFIVKPNYGARGKGVLLVNKEEELEEIYSCKDYVFQEYLQNTGDWRAIVLGGRVLGIMKRTGSDGSFLNNVSRGGQAVIEKNEEVIRKVRDIALTSASVFDLTFCGVDVIKDESTNEFHFLEVNTALEWKGFQSATGIDVSGQLVDFMQAMARRKNNTTKQLVREYYDNHINDVPNKKFHYYSRLYLWAGDDIADKELKALQEEYIGKTSDQIRKRLDKINNNYFEPYSSRIDDRKQKITEYEELRRYNSILFKVLFAETIYGLDIRKYVKELNLDKQMIQMYKDLKKDKKAICVIATRVINFMYLLPYYLSDDPEFFGQAVSTEEILDTVLKFDDFVPEGISSDERLRLKMYVMSHVIICASHFYAHKVKDNSSRKIMEIFEHELRNNYFQATLDQKLEFLVCGRLCEFYSDLRPVIINEAKYSLSSHGNYLIDVHTSAKNTPSSNDRLDKAEHRNALYLMATSSIKQKKNIEKSSKSKQKNTLGRLPKIDLPRLGLHGIKARADTGAFFNAINCSYIKENNGVLQIKVLDSTHPKYRGEVIEFNSYRKTPVKNTSGKYEERYLIETDVIVSGETYRTRLTLTDRSNMMFPVLLGRSFLKNRFLIDASKR